MYRMTVIYDHPADPEKFLKHYREVHAPLASQTPGLRSFQWSVAEMPDGSRPPHFVVAALDWDSKEDALAALATPAGQAGAEDIANFVAPGGVSMSFSEVITYPL
ncbi:EthD family reductase [Streptomyces fractus]|uniref:EthD family reductase n=1 Tax=Streptomyces fractus TaxID=641806 RepID=UPI003CF2A235